MNTNARRRSLDGRLAAHLGTTILKTRGRNATKRSDTAP